MAVDNPRLWWPSCGAQPLYTVEVYLERAGKTSTNATSVGLRTVELRREPDQWGQSRCLCRQQRAKSLPRAPAGFKTDSFLRSCGEVNASLRAIDPQHAAWVLRVGWRLLKEALRPVRRCGILVWQDGVYSCSIYPLDRGRLPGERITHRGGGMYAACAIAPAWRCGAATTR
ncbi:MAG: hypothetical protein H6643_09710 [Caldilineaceae bacterium]|nr:hypothetical protein [Caldilineaceae bacterium]